MAVVIKSWAVWRELVLWWIGIVVYFLTSYEAQFLVVDLSVLERAGVKRAQPTPLDVSVARHVYVANILPNCEGRADEQRVDC